MNAELSIIISIAFIISFSPFIAKLIKLPVVAIEIFMGALGAYIGLIDNSLFIFKHLAEFGFIYLMFLAGTEIDLKKFFKMDKYIFDRSILYILLLYLLSIIFVIYFKLSNIFIVIFPLISIGLVASLSKEYGSHLQWIKTSMQVGSLGELVSIIILTIVTLMFDIEYGFEFFKTIFYLFIFVILFMLSFKIFRVLFWWFSELSTFLMPHLDNKEQDIRLSISILFILIALMLFLNIELALGAFLAGTFIPTFFEHKKDLPDKLSGIGFGFLIPVFFIHIGSMLDIKSLLEYELVLKAFYIMLIMFAIRIIAAFAFYDKLKIKQSVLIALSHSMPITLLIAVATLAYNSKSIDNFHFSAFILASILEVVFAMIIIKIIMNKKV